MFTWVPRITGRFTRPLLSAGAAVAGSLVLAFLRRPRAGAARVHAEGRPRPWTVPALGTLARGGAGGVGPFTWPTRAIPNADDLRALVVTVIANVRAPVAVRNACHHLMVAIEQENQTLVDEIMVNLAHVADRTGYRLPPLAASATLA